MTPTFLQSLVVRVYPPRFLFCWLIQRMCSRPGRRVGRYLRRPALLSNRHRQNAVTIFPGLRESRRLQGHLQRCGERYRWECPWWSVFRLSPWLPRRLTNFPSLPAAMFFVTYDTLKQTLPVAPPVNHMLSASIGEVVYGSDSKLTTGA